MPPDPDRILSDFIDAWNAGRRPEVDDYVGRADEADREIGRASCRERV